MHYLSPDILSPHRKLIGLCGEYDNPLTLNRTLVI